MTSFWKYTLLILFVGLSLQRVNASADSIPMQAHQIADRTVELSWDSPPGIATTVLRTYPGDNTQMQIAVTTDSFYIDHLDRAVCDDTVRYGITKTIGNNTYAGFAAVKVDSDEEPTTMATWGVVTIDDETQQLLLQWNPSPDTDIMGYLVCEGTPSLAIDTVFGRNNTQYRAAQFAIDEVHFFRICAFDSCRKASEITDACNNMVLRIATEPCNLTVTASWNEYLNMPVGVDHYEVWISENDSPFRETARVAGNSTCSTTFTIASNTVTLKVYVKAVGSQYYAISNKVEWTFSSAERPRYMYLRKVSVDDNGAVVNITGQTDPMFPSNDYRIYRSVDGAEPTIVAHCQPDATGQMFWQDYSANPKESPVSYFFGVIDGCGRNEVRSQKGTTLLPYVTERGEDLVITWNPYDGWDGTTSYEVLKASVGSSNWVSLGFTTATTFIYSSYLSDSDGAMQFKIVASEGDDSQWHHSDILQSFARQYTKQISVWLPNVFTPTEASNNRFKPQFVYMNPDRYHFIIYNREGLLLFQTTDTDAEWDGRYKGNLMPSGVYVYKITYRQTDGTDQQIVGTVLLVQ